MRSISMLSIICLAVSVTSCASIIKGSTQEVMVNTTPTGASCDVQRDGATIAQISNTPGSATIKKTKEDLSITCSKAGYQTASQGDRSGLEIWNLGNLLIGGLIGFSIDWIDGAWNKYKSPMNITLPPTTVGGTQPPTPTQTSSLK